MAKHTAYLILLGLFLLAGCGGGGGHDMAVTRTYTIAANVDNCRLFRYWAGTPATARWARYTDVEILTADIPWGSPWALAGSDINRGFFRWPLDIPAGSIIIEAHATFTSSRDDYPADPEDTKAFNAQLYLIDADNCANISTLWPTGTLYYETELVTPFAMETDPAPVTWPITAVAWPKDGEHETTDIKALVQGFIDRAGYASGNYIGIVLHEGDAKPAGDPPALGAEGACRFVDSLAGTHPAVLTIRYKRWGDRWYKWAQARP